MSSTIHVVMLAAALLLVGGASFAPTAEACGFEHEEHIGPVEWGMHCTMPYVEVHKDEIYDLLP